MQEPDPPPPSLPTARLTWTADGVPVASDFEDGYFDRADPLGETRHVFLDGCGLPSVWRGRARFSVGETGFGTGLSLLMIAALWAETAAERPVGARLDLLSVEGRPLSAADLARAHRWLPPRLAPLAERLRRQWPPPYRGFHRLAFPEIGVRFTLILDEVEPALAAVDPGAGPGFDAWCLDGFAPAHNPAMWTEAVLGHVVRLSAPGARIASFTAAGAVRRRLEALGAQVDRRPGFGRKRHCLAARLPAAHRPQRAADRPDWAPPASIHPPGAPIAVLGAGVAGRWLARRLAEAGLQVALVGRDAADHPPAALIAPKLVRGAEAYGRLSALAYVAAVRAMDALESDRPAGAPAIWRARGVLEPAPDAETRARLAALAETFDWPETWLRLTADGLLHPRAGVIDPDALHRLLWEQAAAAGARRLSRDVARIERTGGLWRLVAADGGAALETPTLIVAAGATGFGLLPDAARWSAVQPSGGRLFRPVLDPGSAPETALAYGGFLTGALDEPAGPARALLGASARRAATPAEALAAEDGRAAESLARCLRRLERVRPDLAASLAAGPTPESWVGVRAGTPDHLPHCGPAPDADAYRAAYRALARGARAAADPPGAVERPGLFVVGALGARGYQLAPLLADVLTAELTGAPPPVAARDRAALHPARFLMRAMAREPA
ncbi:MAG: FAD-dependent 5-carboxymethylaminomethyl-2-thiouridine(34) oxidoreductase MnmC [Alphaproteobacteria bacterium]|nr:FAD-dependent 5-carboxymethylaminomethyl-2-thiouridine(34) oxidoreductase MnmC [Alphaproteobacteria bacterium]